VYAVSVGDPSKVGKQLSESVTSTAQIVFFLMGAMTIVEVVDAHNGFHVVTRRIRTSKLPTLVWLVGSVTFFLSAILDNLTTTIVMVSLMRKLLAAREDRLMFAGVIVIAANFGGAWSPIGDVTTTMLWIGGQIIKGVFLPSLVSMAAPLAVAAYGLKGRQVISREARDDDHAVRTSEFEPA
jgi:Na+/H+ antiporter NhaD/arsenite permease-like protein